MAPAPLELCCFGPPSARLAGARAAAPPALTWRKHLALLVYLALSPDRSRSRDHLLGLLWPEQPERAARKSLNMAVSRLRDVLGDDRLRTVSDVLALNDQALEVDALRVLAVAEDDPASALRWLRGEFLEGFHIKEASQFEDWMTQEREHYRGLTTRALVAAGERYLSAGAGDATELARRALALTPHSEPAVRLLMRAAALTGDAATALAAYREFVSVLKAEVGETPSRALAELADRIRSRSWRPAGSERPEETPLVGREGLHGLAFETIARGMTRNGGPQSLVITGAPGMGRSRLLAECVRRLALDGALVLQARPVESDHDARWSALRLLSRAGLAEAPGFPAARRESLSAFATLVPELEERFPPREIRDVADMGSALADVLRAITDERPVAIAIDDAQWADGASLAALGAALTAVSRMPLTLIVTIPETVVDPPRALLNLETDVGRAIPGATVRLAPLAASDLAALVAALATWCPESVARDRLTRRLVFESGGNPFFAVTLLGALAKANTFRSDMLSWPPERSTYETPLPFSIPSTVKHAIGLRIAELQSEEVAVVGAASVCGQAIDAEVLAAVSGKPADVITRALLSCERRYLIQFDGRRYTFVAPLIALVVRSECLTKGERHALEQRAVVVLASRNDLESRALRLELLAAHQADQQTLDLALDIGREAVDSGARRIVQRALACAEMVSRQTASDHARVADLRRRMEATFS